MAGALFYCLPGEKVKYMKIRRMTNRSRIYSDSIFLKKYYIIAILKKKKIVLWFIFNKVKKGISHCIFNSCAEGFKGFFKARKLIFFGQMACIYILNCRGDPQSFDFDITFLYPIIVTPYL